MLFNIAVLSAIIVKFFFFCIFVSGDLALTEF